MASYNKVMLMGNLTRDPEVRYTPKGSAVADLALAVNRVYTADNNEKREEVTYVDVVLWARLAELAGQYLKKGNPVFIEGRLQMDSWEDKQTGQKRSRLRVVGEVMQFLGGKREGEGGEQFNSGGGSSAGNGGGGGGYQSSAPRSAPQRSSSPQRPASQSRPPAGEEYGEGPITDGLDDDDIPF
jgi:single-strand DNA-binding protein